MGTTAEIELVQSIPLILAAVDGKGKPIPGAVLSNVSWAFNTEIGTIEPDPTNPNLATFRPTKPGTVTFKATATVTIS
jgi:hypothetical protein